MKCYGGGGGEFESRAVLRDSPQWERVTGAICDLLWFLLLIKMWLHPRHFFKVRHQPPREFEPVTQKLLLAFSQGNLLQPLLLQDSTLGSPLTFLPCHVPSRAARPSGCSRDLAGVVLLIPELSAALPMPSGKLLSHHGESRQARPDHSTCLPMTVCKFFTDPTRWLMSSVMMGL